MLLIQNRRFLRGALLLAAALWPERASAQLPNPLRPANATPLVYCPPERLAEGPASAQHVLNVFLPLGPAPAGGWPVVLATGYGGGASVPPLAALRSVGGTSPLWKLVEAGIAVVLYGTPGIGQNRGLWYPDGHPSGRAESFRPAHDNPEKSAVWSLQWLKVQTLYPFDLERIGLRGSSGGAALAMRTAMGPDHARASGSAQVRASTRVAAVLAIQPPTSAWALAQGPELTIEFPKHLEQAARPGVMSLQLDQADPELQKDYSLMRSAFASPEARANNAQQALALVYGDPVLRIGGAVATFELDAGGFPLLYDRIVQPQQHDSWFGYVFWKRLLELSGASGAFHAQNSMFAMRDVNALAPPLDLHTHTYGGDVKGPQANGLGHDWLVARLTGVVTDPGPPDPPDPPMPDVSPYGCDQSRSESLVLASGAPLLGTTPVFGVQAAVGARVRVYLARAPAPGYPCGQVVSAGERLLDPTTLLGRPREVGTAPNAQGRIEVPLPLPRNPALAGSEVFVQALVFTPGQPASWTNGLVLRLGP